MKVHKGHGLGNDYLVVDQSDMPCAMTPAHARYLCDRHRGFGCDGVLLADVAHGIKLRIINPDGTEAEKSGNGLRIFGAYLHGRGIVQEQWFDVELVKDTVKMRIEEVQQHGVLMIRVEMGTASFTANAAGFAAGDPEGEVLAHNVALNNGRHAVINAVSLSNPHCVVFLDNLDRADFLERAPQLCTHDLFPRGTNVQFAKKIDEHTIDAWIWERGAGETMASGSSASAVCAAAVRRGIVQPGVFEVRMEGGSAEVEVSENYEVKLRGPAQMILEGALTAGALQEYMDLPTS